jgi:membrane protein YdbS with pleckstrin-like domain
MKVLPRMIWSMNIIALIFYVHSFLIFKYASNKLGALEIILVTAFIAFIPLFFKKLWRDRTIFELGENDVKFYRKFLTLSQKNVKYSNIKEVKLSQNIIQRFYGIATVLVTTHATTQDAGIEIYDIKEYQEVYDFLIEKTKNHT